MTDEYKQKEVFMSELFETVPNSLRNEFFFLFLKKKKEKKKEILCSKHCCYLTLL